MHIRNWPALAVADEHDLPGALSTYALELEERELARRAIGAADMTHAISAFTAGLVEEAGAAPRVEVIPPSIDVPRFASVDTTDDPGPVVTLARFVDRKNIETVIDAWERLPGSVTADRELIVAGDGPNRERLEERASTLEGVRFTGWVQGTEKAELLARADVFALVPRRDEFDVEGFGIVYIEAQAAGAPVVGSKHGGAPEAIGDAGIVVDDENDPQEVADAIEVLLTDDDRRGACLSAADSRIGQFDIPAVAADHEAVYRDLRSDRPSS